MATSPENLQNARPLEPVYSITAFRIPARMLFAIDGWCLQHDLSRSQFIRSCIRERLKALEVELEPYPNN